MINKFKVHKVLRLGLIISVSAFKYPSNYMCRGNVFKIKYDNKPMSLI